MKNEAINKPAYSRGTFISALFLVAGTCIGGGMLALPVVTGVSGFLPSSLMMLICWAAMTLSALFLLEANLWLKEGAHVISMASVFLGPVGRAVSWIIYLFISYASLVAYTAGGGDLIIYCMQVIFGLALSKPLGYLLFILLFGSIIYLGTHVVGRINTILFSAMVISYVVLIGSGIGEVKFSLLGHTKWTTSILAIPLLLTTFSFQTMLPSLTPYLHKNGRALRLAVIGGTTLTLIIYLLWQIMVLGIIPVEGPHSLIDALRTGEPITQYLRAHTNSQWVAMIAEYFAFFALVTSFLGMGLGLFDFLADGLKIKKTGWGHVLLGVLIAVPIYFFAVYFERVFLVALETTGGFGDTILNGIMPVLMVWIGRYYLKFPNENRTPGGKILLAAVFLFFTFSFILALCSQFGLITVPT